MPYSYFERLQGLFIVHSTIGNTVHFIPSFEQFGALHMHSHDDKYLSRPGFEPGTPRLQCGDYLIRFPALPPIAKPDAMTILIISNLINCYYFQLIALKPGIQFFRDKRV